MITVQISIKVLHLFPNILQVCLKDFSVQTYNLGNNGNIN